MSGERYRLTWASSCLLVFSVHVRSWHILRMSFVVFVYWYALFVHDIFWECLLLFLFIGMLCSFMTYFENVFCCFCLLVCSVCSWHIFRMSFVVFVYWYALFIHDIFWECLLLFLFIGMLCSFSENMSWMNRAYQ
jgi:hypothetical protein